MKNDKDPVYLERVQANVDRRKVLVLEASLPWKLPGETMEQKVQWLHDRPAGEIAGLYFHILKEVNNFQDRSGFM